MPTWSDGPRLEPGSSQPVVGLLGLSRVESVLLYKLGMRGELISWPQLPPSGRTNPCIPALDSQNQVEVRPPQSTDSVPLKCSEQ